MGMDFLTTENFGRILIGNTTNLMYNMFSNEVII